MNPRVPAFDYLSQYRELQGEVLASVERVLGSGQLILGPEVEAFEKEFVEYLGGAGLGIGVNSGTDALVVALKAWGIGPGDEVVTVANTAVPTVSAIRETGATPVFCDVDPATCLMDLERLDACQTPRTKAIVPVHLYGNVVDVPRIREMVQGRDIFVLEDCAQAHGARLRGRMAGTLAHAAAFSFYPTKNLGAYGDAGLCVTSDAALAARMRSIRMYGFEGRYCSEREGKNSRLDPLQAAILRIKLRHLPRYVRMRQELSAIYDGELSHILERVRPAEGVEHARHLYVVRVKDRDRVRAELEERGIGTGIHYPFPIHLMRGYEFLGYRPGSLPRTEALAQEVLSLPLYPELPPEDVRRVCRELNGIVRCPPGERTT